MELITKKEEFVLNWINSRGDGFIILDIGANKGFYSESVLNIIKEKVEKIFCFEPVKKNFDICTRKFINNNKVEVFEKGCSNEHKEVKFFEIVSSDIGAEGLSSINYRNVFKNYNYNEIIVDCIIIDEFLTINSNSLVFAKIDTEGHELEVLCGMKNLFKENRLFCVQFEYGDCMLEKNKNLNDIILFLKEFENNYILCDFDIEKNEFFEINDKNIKNYINEPWNNLYILKNS